MTNLKLNYGHKITKYNNDDYCYVYYYTNIHKTQIDNNMITFKYAKKKFGINENNYNIEILKDKTIYTRK